MNPKTKTIEIPAGDIHPGDRVISIGSQHRRPAREVARLSAHLGGRERLLEFKDGGPDLIVKPDHCLTVEEGEAGRAARMAAGEAYTRIGPGAREIEAGDEVVVLDGKGGIDHEGVLRDVFDGDRAEVQTGTRKWIMVPLDRVAHPDSEQGEACAMAGTEAAAS
jgi:hypothetical protein